MEGELRVEVLGGLRLYRLLAIEGEVGGAALQVRYTLPLLHCDMGVQYVGLEDDPLVLDQLLDQQ